MVSPKSVRTICAVHRGPHHEPALLRRVAGSGVEEAGLGIFHQRVDEEQRRALHQRIGGVAQELLVAGEQVVLPQVRGEPGAAGLPDAVIAGVDGRRAAPQVEVVVQHPAAARCSAPSP